MTETIKSSAPCPVYVVSLPDAIERRAGIKRQLDSLGVAFEFVDAVRGSALTKEQRAQMVGPESETIALIDRPMTDGEIGCSLSHQHIYEKVLKEGHQYAMVLEDDALLLPGFADALKAAIGQDIDILLFGYSKWGKEEVAKAWLFDPVVETGQLASGHIYGLRTRLSSHGTVAYLVSAKASQKLRMNYPVITVADDYPTFSRYVQVTHLRPLAVMEDNQHVSTIRGDFRRNRHGLSIRQTITYTLRGLWRHALVFMMVLGGAAKRKGKSL